MKRVLTFPEMLDEILGDGAGEKFERRMGELERELAAIFTTPAQREQLARELGATDEFLRRMNGGAQ